MQGFCVKRDPKNWSNGNALSRFSQKIEEGGSIETDLLK